MCTHASLHYARACHPFVCTYSIQYAKKALHSSILTRHEIEIDVALLSQAETAKQVVDIHVPSSSDRLEDK